MLLRSNKFYECYYVMMLSTTCYLSNAKLYVFSRSNVTCKCYEAVKLNSSVYRAVTLNFTRYGFYLGVDMMNSYYALCNYIRTKSFGAYVVR